MPNEQNNLYKQMQRRVISCLLFRGEDSNKVMEILEPDDFEEPNLEIIFSALVVIARRNETVSAVSIAHELEKAGLLERSGGPAGLYLMRDEGKNFLRESPVELYATIVKESSVKAKVSKTLRDYEPIFKNDSGKQAVEGISELQSTLNEELYRLSDESTSSRLDEDFDKYLELVEERRRIAEENTDLSEGLQGIPSLIPSLNEYTTGWLAGQVIVVGARTGIGKSVLAVNCAVAAALSAKSVMFFSLEMSDSEVKDRIFSSTTGIPMNKFRQGRLLPEEEEKVKEMSDQIRSMKIQIETEARVTIDSIRAKALKKAQSPAGLDFIIVDYLQLITPVGRFASRQEAVADMSRNIKVLAKQLQVPIMILVQVLRGGDEEENALPRMDKIRESGAIAQDADVVVLIHRDKSTDDNIPHTLLLLEKNRSGPTNKIIRCHSNLECSLFREVVRAKDVELLSEEDAAAALENSDELDFDEDLF